ncbi:hypothetical protein LMG19282_00386 [Cupriavidus campinensis]|uniref:DsbA family protein n=1 Tax=Cupriavidus campinensis TaxID=151783 RepID=UPI001B17B7B2|nr:DsbA family protein [Cupriavidus campinensis]CAG2131170.1 hypothetical protein LMG19282_00386 [Cupriavidus campinensis]
MELVYVGDPMCSWCYGFGKELTEVRERFPDLPLRIVVGGIRAGATDILDEAGKRFRLHHWSRVESASGLPFNRDGLMARENFVYDTEPICRAVVTARQLFPQSDLLAVFRALQAAFYVDALDTTDGKALADVAAQALNRQGHAVSAQTFLDQWLSDAAIAATVEDFRTARGWGISSFPALVLDHGGRLHHVSGGYAHASDVAQQLKHVMEAASAAA